MTKSELRTLLASHRALGTAPEKERDWLVEHAVYHVLEAGEVVTPRGAQATSLHIMFSGHVVIRMDRGAGAHKIFEWRGGDVGGLMPYSRGASPPNDAVAEERTEMLHVARELFPELIRECPIVTTTLVHTMVDRARQFTSSNLRDEKLISLGKLAAGLAHELNNPASAVVRSAKALSASLTDAESAAKQLAAACLSAEQFDAIEAARASCTGISMTTGMSSIDQSDREDLIAEWLADHGASEEPAHALADTAVTTDTLDVLAEHLSGEALDAAVRWMAACCAVRALSSEIETAASRISHLVGSVKSFSFMDRTATPEPVDIQSGIADTIAMLSAKRRKKDAEVVLEIPDDLPRAHAVGAELNQVWMNLIDNALDAVENGGHIAVVASRERNLVIVRIIDDGPGIPTEIQERIYEPFFTTKGVGKGTGLGLDIVRRLLQQHEGELALESRPGHTEFQVRLPVAHQPT